jgi:hypothetical protein
LLGPVGMLKCGDLGSEVEFGSFGSAVAGLHASDGGEMVSFAVSLVGIVSASRWAIIEGLPVLETDVALSVAGSTILRGGADAALVIGKAEQAGAARIRGVAYVGAKKRHVAVQIQRAVAFGESCALGVEVVRTAVMAVEASAAVASSVAKPAVAKSLKSDEVGHSGEAVVMAWDGCVCV